ncbi:hypothetical protein P9386_12395 [Caldifermentibacillus hisashii]|uniref:PTS sugar transporter subunit IIA n=1 Tax=Bacillaceae TaxID=186817 RepID=UPI0022E7E86D|nr:MULTISPECIES: hypothetical protein [Bacillaceae]MED4852619.1 hypothetical protein [Caldifermentibacillus hisashii]
MRKIIVATHGELSKGIVHTLGVIIGEEITHSIDTYSLLPGEDVNDIAESIEKEITSAKEKNLDYVILTDIAGGSVHNTLLRLVSYPNVWVITGVNLIMLLDIILSDSNNSTQTVLEKALENARLGITLQSCIPDNLSNDLDNDDL